MAIRTDGSMACLSRGRPRRFAARRDQLPLGGREHPLQSHHQEITEEVRMDVSRTTPDELLLKSRDPVADGSLNLAL
jgi:hypothetical protein